MRKPTILIATFTIVLTTAVLTALELGFARTWGGVLEDEGEGVAVATDGSVYTTGSTLNFGAGDRDAFLLKYGSDGTLLWQRTWGRARTEPNLRADDFATDVAVSSSDGSVYITGFDGNDAFLVKFDSAGNLLWQKTWGGPSTDFAFGVAVAPNGTVYVTGATDGFGDVFLASFTPAGALVWQVTWGGAGLDVAQDIDISADGSIYIGGETNSFFANDAFIAKFAPDGSLMWDRVWREGTIEDISGGLGVAAAPDGTVYLAGNAQINLVGQDIFVANFTSEGDLLWNRTWGDNLSSAHDVTVGSDGNVYVTGNTGFGAGNGDAFILKLLPDGRVRDASTWGGPETDSGQSIAAAADGSVFVAGTVGASPHVFDRAKRTSKRPDAFLADPAAVVVAAAGVVADATGIVLIPTGSETFAGATDAALLKVLPE